MKSSLGVQFDSRAPGELIPLLVHDIGNRIAIATREQFARNIGEMLLILSPTQTSREFEIGCDVIIDLPEGGVGI